MGIGIILEFCQLVFESGKGESRFCGESEEFVTTNKWVSIAFGYYFLCWNMSLQEILDERRQFSCMARAIFLPSLVG